MKDVRHSLPSLVHLFKTIEEHERNVMSVKVYINVELLQRIFAISKRVKGQLILKCIFGVIVIID